MEGPSVQRLRGKVTIITGGASGIGESTARLFAQHGSKLIVADVQDDKGESLCKELTSNGNTATYAHCDVTSNTDITKVVNLAMTKHGKLDIMFCNAGITGEANWTLAEVESHDFKKVFDVNVYGCFLGAKEASRVMIPAKSGAILFTSSIASIMGGFTPHAYTMSKHAVVGLMKGLSVELGQHGIRVNCVAPSFIATPLLREMIGVTERGSLENVMHESAVLKGTVLREDDIAKAALFLASDDAKYVNGLNLVVDGGYTITNMSFSKVLHESFISGSN